MEAFLGSVAFACLIAAQFFAVVAAHGARCEKDPDRRDAFCGDDRARHIWKFGS